MSNNINNVGNRPNIQTNQSQGTSGQGTHREKTKFGKFMSKVGDGALSAASAVAPALPGGQLIKAAANGLQNIKNQTPQSIMAGGNAAEQNSIQDMFQMQKQNQMMNMQYMQLQQQAQAQNRQFKTMSNLMKVRHDTAKSAINNMRA